ncbi:MAG: deoxyguanosinetriphosphate triphosphohydrolase [Thermomicrobiales bacterium]|nr:deoxyguanosinetriphosphate triphosphohydrolase [Thermomicrobiales bacterium]
MNDDTIRERYERHEIGWLAPLATRSAGVERPQHEEPDPTRTAFQRDRDRIIHTKSFRRLMHKTQVFIAPAGDHYRTRLTHTLEVTQIARTIGRALRLNEDLIEAIGMGHDLGHTPFGHAGETALGQFLPGFRHNEQSLRVVDFLENDGKGLNLSHPVRDGILRHSKPDEAIDGAVSGSPGSLEGEVLKISDGIAYINHDLDDAIRAGIIIAADVPDEAITTLGDRHAKRIDTLVRDIIANSESETAPGRVAMSPDVLAAANVLRRFLFERVYRPLNEVGDTLRAQRVVLELCDYYSGHPEEMPDEYQPGVRGDSLSRVVADYVASMTDRFAIERFRQLFVPRYWSV